MVPLCPLGEAFFLMSHDTDHIALLQYDILSYVELKM